MAVAQSFQSIFSEVETLLASGDLLGIISKDQDFAYYSEEAERYEYLSSLSEDHLFLRYHRALLSFTKTPLSNFSSSNRDQLEQLRFRAVLKYTH